MAIKQPNILTRQEFDQAMVHLRLNVSEVSRETSIPRTYISEFRNGDRQLRPENLAKLRDYFEGKGLEFDNEPEPDNLTEQAPIAAPPKASSHCALTICGLIKNSAPPICALASKQSASGRAGRFPCLLWPLNYCGWF